jgi:hypothetical protein
MARIYLMALMFALCAGCGAVAEQSKNSELSTTLIAYANVIRWGDFEQALTFVDPKTLKEHPLSTLDKERYKQVRVISYNERPVVPDGPSQVIQVVEIGVLNINTQTERNIVDKQVWRYDETSKHWHISSGLPDITQH